MSRSSNERPILYLKVSAADNADDKRLHAALVEIAGRDHSISVKSQPEAAVYTLSAKSESQLERICNRLRDKYQLAIDATPPEAILIEAIRKQAEAEGKYIRQTGGSGNYGHCKVRIEPNEPGNGYEFINGIKGNDIPKAYIKPIDLGIRSAMELGVLAGFPILDLKATLLDGSYHEMDSHETAFRFAGSIALKEAAKKASPVLLEPVMAVEIDVVEELAAEIRHEIQVHRGRIERAETVNSLTRMMAIVPLSELLPSTSKRLAQFPMEFAGYEPVSNHGPSDENAAGVTVNKPNHPRPSKRSGTAQHNPEEC